MTDEQPQITADDISDEDLKAYIAALEEESGEAVEKTKEEIASELQAQFVVDETARLNQARRERHIKALRRAFKGINSRPQIIDLATVGLLRVARMRDEQIVTPDAEATA